MVAGQGKYGWEPTPFVWHAKPSEGLEPSEGYKPLAAALVLKRRIPIRGFAARLNILYIPKGPLMDWSNEPLRKRVLDDLQSFAKRQGAIFLKIDPDVVMGTGIPESEDNGVDNNGQAVMSELKRRAGCSHQIRSNSAIPSCSICPHPKMSCWHL